MSLHAKLILFGLGVLTAAPSAFAATTSSQAAIAKVAAKPTPAPTPLPPPPGPALPPHFGIFEVTDKPSPNALALRSPDGKETLNVEMMSILDNDSYHSAVVVKNGVTVDFSKDGARVFHNYTVTHVGKKLAFAVNGHVVATMIIKQAVEGKVTLAVSPKDASEVVASVNRKSKVVAPAPMPSPIAKKAAVGKK